VPVEILCYSRGMLKVNRGPAFFISDAHLGTGTPEEEQRKTARLLLFFDRLPGNTESIWILGDLFDFWFEYAHAIPKKYFAVLARLAALASRGTEIVYVGGNHDFWLGSFFEKEIGAKVFCRPVEASIGPFRTFLAHGDGLVRPDLGYRVLKGVLRNPLAIRLYRALHPDVGIPLANLISRASRRKTSKTVASSEKLFRQVALPHFEAGFDAVILGHIHRPEHRVENGKHFLVLGDWMEHFSYARFEAGKFSLAAFREEDSWPPPA